jgi:hypothetical protein
MKFSLQMSMEKSELPTDEMACPAFGMLGQLMQL